MSTRNLTICNFFFIKIWYVYRTMKIHGTNFTVNKIFFETFFMPLAQFLWNMLIFMSVTYFLCNFYYFFIPVAHFLCHFLILYLLISYVRYSILCHLLISYVTCLFFIRKLFFLFSGINLRWNSNRSKNLFFLLERRGLTRN